jgi:hypothetical protein
MAHSDFYTRAGISIGELNDLISVVKIFLGHDDRFQIAVGGNPLAAEQMLAAAKRALVRAEGALKAMEGSRDV